MDTSEIYIKMCGKATEIQGLWDADDGDLHLVRTTNRDDTVMERVDMWCAGCNNEFLMSGEVADLINRSVWLPRQDQLQEMEGGEGLFALVEDFSLSVKNHYVDSNKPIFKSMEQLWLAFVMNEKYGKTWSGEEWTQ